jgi:hypothetical protein
MDLTIRGSIPDRGTKYFPVESAQIDTGVPIPSPVQSVTEVLSPEVKRSLGEVHYTPLCTAEFKNEPSHTSTPPRMILCYGKGQIYTCTLV